jgi:hypothetical protein
MLALKLTYARKMNKVKKVFSYILIIILIVIAIVFVTKKQFQNDTFYSIRVGKILVHEGIHALDIDTISWHENLKYCNPHWLSDIIIYLSYSLDALDGVFILTVVETLIVRLVDICFF